MDNQFTRLDSYGRLIGVSPTTPGWDPAKETPTEPLSDPDWAECEEVWARAERVKKLEDTVIMLTDRVNQCNIRIAVLEISPLERMPEKSKSIGNIANPPHEPDWVERELAAIKNTATERVCGSCKWGVRDVDGDIDCHFSPEDITHGERYWCSKWCEK